MYATHFLPIFQFTSCYLCILVTIICNLLTVSRITRDDPARWFMGTLMTLRIISYLPIFIVVTSNLSWVTNKPTYFMLIGFAFAILNLCYFREALHPGSFRLGISRIIVTGAMIYTSCIVSCFLFFYYLQTQTSSALWLPHETPSIEALAKLFVALWVSLPMGLLLWEGFLEPHTPKVRRWIQWSIGYEVVWLTVCILTIFYQNLYCKIAFFHTCLFCTTLRTYLELGYRKVNPSSNNRALHLNHSMYDDERCNATPNHPIAKPDIPQLNEPNTQEMHRYFLWLFEQNKLWRNPNLTAEGLAQYFHVDKATMLNTIQSNVSLTFRQVMDRYRVHDLMELLENEECSTFEEAASQAGFASTSLAAGSFLVVMGINYKEWMRTLEKEPSKEA